VTTLGHLVSEDYPLTSQNMHLGAGTQGSAIVVRLFTGVLVVRLCALSGQPVLAFRGSVPDGPTGGVQIAVGGVLHQPGLGLLKPLGLALAGLSQWPLGLTRSTIDGSRLRTRPAADRRRLGAGAVSFFLGAVGVWHR
jgi:hypothetical protein